MGQLDQLNACDSTRAEEHFIAELLGQCADRLGGLLPGCGILLIIGDLHKAHAAGIQRVCDLAALVGADTAHDGDQLFLFNSFYYLFTHTDFSFDFHNVKMVIAF